MTDGTIELRPPRKGDAKALVNGFDDAARKYLGDVPHPDPWACIIADDVVVGWIDYDFRREWLAPTEANIGFLTFAPDRGRHFASRALQLLVQHHLPTTECTKATMLIDRDNIPSLRLAERSGFTEEAPVDGERFFTLEVVHDTD